MINTIEISSYKSIDRLKLDLGRVNVLIGENGAGKSNILEAIALSAAASAQKLDNEFLASRGIRVTQAEQMRPAFEGFSGDERIVVKVHEAAGAEVIFELSNDNAPYSQWRSVVGLGSDELNLNFSELMEHFASVAQSAPPGSGDTVKESVEKFSQLLIEAAKKGVVKSSQETGGESKSISVSFDIPGDDSFAQILVKNKVEFKAVSNLLADFIIYSPENTSLRTFQKEGQIEPLGVNGEGLLKLLHVLSDTDPDVLKEIKEALCLFGWFKDFSVIRDAARPGRMEIWDRYLADGRAFFDQRSANEGFLFLAFYFALFSNSLTPKFFAVDNIDASLNPKLCQRLMRELVVMAQRHDKQVILTTHNPAILDGLNLDDDNQRLFAVSRNSKGHTRVTRIEKPKLPPGVAPVRLSEAFLRGAIGGLPRGF